MHLSAMLPRKRVRTKASDVEVGDDISGVIIELGDGKTDTNNMRFLSLVTEAWETVQGHDVFARAGFVATEQELHSLAHLQLVEGRHD